MRKQEDTAKPTEKTKKGGRRAVSAFFADTLGSDTAVLRGAHGAAVYGCRRILFYAPERICLSRGKEKLCVRGRELICTSFCAGSVTVSGEVEGIFYCRGSCEGACPEEGV